MRRGSKHQSSGRSRVYRGLCLQQDDPTPEPLARGGSHQGVGALSEANTSIRWLLLQPTTADSKLEAVCRISARMRGDVRLGSMLDGMVCGLRLGALVDTALPLGR